MRSRFGRNSQHLVLRVRGLTAFIVVCRERNGMRRRVATVFEEPLKALDVADTADASRCGKPAALRWDPARGSGRSAS